MTIQNYSDHVKERKGQQTKHKHYKVHTRKRAGRNISRKNCPKKQVEGIKEILAQNI